MKPFRRSLFLTLGSLVVLAFSLVACGTETSADKLIINEVYTNPGQQWVELFNNSGADLSLTGWALQTPRGTINLGANAPTSLPNKGYLVVTGKQEQFTSYAKDFGLAKIPALIKYTDGSIIGDGLKPDGDVIVLTLAAQTATSGTSATPATTSGTTIINGGSAAPAGLTAVDDISWGTKPGGDSADTFFKQFNNVTWQGSPAPTQFESLGRTPNGTEGDRNAANPGSWTIHLSPAPGGTVTPPSDKNNWFLKETTNALTAIGGLLLWVAFIMIGFIARRFQTLSQQRTYWLALMAAPFLILVYLAIVVVSFSQPGGALTDSQKWQGFTVLLGAGILCLLVVSIFRRIARTILEAE